MSAVVTQPLVLAIKRIENTLELAGAAKPVGTNRITLKKKKNHRETTEAQIIPTQVIFFVAFWCWNIVVDKIVDAKKKETYSFYLRRVDPLR